jgi:hypothetical protein
VGHGRQALSPDGKRERAVNDFLQRRPEGAPSSEERQLEPGLPFLFWGNKTLPLIYTDNTDQRGQDLTADERGPSDKPTTEARRHREKGV